MKSLQINGLSKSFQNKFIFKDLNFTFEQNKIYGLLGPNGAGKSTFLRTVLGLYKSDKGQIFWDSTPFNFELHNEFIGFMPEERGLFKKMKIAEQVIYLARLKGLSRIQAITQTKYWFQKFNIIDWWDIKPEELSKGMSQKIQFIVAIINDPQLIILDEPFSGLDPINAQLIESILHELKNLNKIIVLSTHRMEQVEDLCDDFILFNQGKILLSGNVEATRINLKKGLFEIETSETISINCTFLNFEIVKHITENKILVQSKYKDIGWNNLLAELLPMNITLKNIKEIYPTMQDIFISIVSENTAPFHEKQS